MALIRGQMVADAWEAVMRETPHTFFFGLLDRDDPRTYRERLDEQPKNHYGDVIPRIVIVRNHLRSYPNLRLDPARLTTPHRHTPVRPLRLDRRREYRRSTDV